MTKIPILYNWLDTLRPIQLNWRGYIYIIKLGKKKYNPNNSPPNICSAFLVFFIIFFEKYKINILIYKSLMQYKNTSMILEVCQNNNLVPNF
jgi:hypothetical protein